MTSALSVTRLIRASPERVFAAWTEPRLLTRWWGPGPVSCPEAHVDLRPGGEYRIANLAPGGSIIWISGRFEAVEPPQRLSYSWSVSLHPDETSRVTVTFDDHPEGTRLELRHERIGSEHLRDGHLLGWTGCLDKLDTLFAVS